MASPQKLYKVYDIATSELLAEGTAKHCANEVGSNVNAIRDIARGKYQSRRFVVVDITPADTPDEQQYDPNGLKAAALKWDAFCDPIRKKYGIPVRRMNDGK